MPKIIIKIENFIVFIISIVFIMSSLRATHSPVFLTNWYLIIILWFSFDLSMVGYLINKRLGSVIYNLVHNYAIAVIVVIIGEYYLNADLSIIGLTLAAHISLDRTMGFGLKYPSGFKNTHIQKI